MKIWRKGKEICAFILAAVLCSGSGSILSAASEPLDLNREGSITISLKNSADVQNSPLSGVKLSLYKIADAKEENYNLVFSLKQVYAGAGVELENFSDVQKAIEEAAVLAEFVADNDIQAHGTLLTDLDGTAGFKSLSCGMYLVLAQSGTGYDIAKPFVVAVPMMNEDRTGWYYDLEALPKAESAAGAVILNKIDPSGKRLQGAVFNLEKRGADGSYQSFEINLVTDAAGQIVKTGLPFGEYRFVEVQAPAGYIISTVYHEFAIHMPGDAVIKDGIYEPSNEAVAVVTAVNRNKPGDHPGGDKPGGGSDKPKPPSDGGADTPPVENLPDSDTPLGALTTIKDNISVILGRKVPLGRLPQTGQDIRRIMLFFTLGAGFIILGWADLKREKRGKKHEET